MELTFIPLDYNYFDFEEKNYIKIIGRTKTGKRVCILDSCDVYLWAILKEKILDKKIKILQEKINKIKIKDTREIRVTKTELHNKKFLGKDVKAIKIFVSNHKDLKKVADKLDFKEIEKRREHDINYPTRYLLEKKLYPLTWQTISGEVLAEEDFGGLVQSLDVDFCIKLEDAPAGVLTKESKSVPKEGKKTFTPKVLAFDIETDELEIGKGEILMISLVGKDFKKVLTCKTCKNLPKFVKHFPSEKQMLEEFVKEIKKYSPDILTGYYSDGFDLPYLKERCKKNKVKLALGLENSIPKFSGGRVPRGKISGIVHIDLFHFISTAYSQYLQSETLGLGDVASELIGNTKKDYEFKHSSKLNSEEWVKFFEYNLHDSVLTYDLFMKVWPDMAEFTKIMKEPLFSVSRDGMASNVEHYLIHNLEKYNEIIEKQPTHNMIGLRRERNKYTGAFVLQPIPKLYEKIVMFDFTSYWPSIISTFNLSYSTFLGEKKQLNSTEVEIKEGNKTKKLYFSKIKGFFPEMLEETIEKRKKYKKEYFQKQDALSKARSNSFKLLANAAYGYQGFFGARYYCLPAAASTAALARKSIHKAIDSIKDQGYKVIYSDTDSIAFETNKQPKTKIQQLLKKINSNLPGIMELDLEGFFKRGIWVTKRTGEFGAKKKYALIDKDNKLKIRGFETVRRDWCNLARQTQNKILQLILESGNSDKATEYLKKIIKQIKNREIPLKQLIIKTQLKKPIEEYKSISPHVTIAKRMQQQNLPVSIGSLIEYYIAEPESTRKTLVRERAKLLDEPGKYDINYYLKNQILPAVENIFEVFNIKTDELLDGKKQMSLGEF